MELIFNTANPIMIIAYTLIIALVICFSKKTENAILIIAAIAVIVCMLIYHSITLDGLNSAESELISNVYRCIAVDLVLLLLSFISFLWIDDIIAKKKKIKSYDDSLSWFWNKL